MSNRYHTIDIAVGAGMCAILLGALLFFVAVCMLAMVFVMKLSLAARNREEKELARIRHDASRWVYRMAS
jgi:hypothetical protein